MVAWLVSQLVALESSFEVGDRVCISSLIEQKNGLVQVQIFQIEDVFEVVAVYICVSQVSRIERLV